MGFSRSAEVDDVKNTDILIFFIHFYLSPKCAKPAPLSRPHHRILSRLGRTQRRWDNSAHALSNVTGSAPGLENTRTLARLPRRTGRQHRLDPISGRGGGTELRGEVSGGAEGGADVHFSSTEAEEQRVFTRPFPARPRTRRDSVVFPSFSTAKWMRESPDGLATTRVR